MEFVGIIVAVSNLEEKQGNANQGFGQCFRDVVVQTQEEFPKGICATLKGDAARDFNLAEGSKVRVFFEPPLTSRKPQANGSPRATRGASTHVKLTKNPLQKSYKSRPDTSG